MLFGTAVSSAMALVLATPLGIAIAHLPGMLAPRGVRAVVGPLVEMLAAIPSVILGFWGVIVLAPFVPAHVEPSLHSVLGFLPIFGPPQTTGLSIFTAGLILTIMVLPIIASLSRDLFLTVPRELKDGAEALGATRWEVIRGVVLPTTVSGVAAATVLGLGRALGEAIAVAQVIGDGSRDPRVLFQPGDDARQPDRDRVPEHGLQAAHPSLFYLALILLVIGVVTNLIAQAIARRFDVSRDRRPDERDRSTRRAPLTPTGNLRRRLVVSRLVVGRVDRGALHRGRRAGDRRSTTSASTARAR